jgi:hypothetical protein
VLHNMLIEFNEEEGGEDEVLPEEWQAANDLIGTGHEEESTSLPTGDQHMRTNILQHCLDMFYIN